jgi:hypothetical protein
MTHPQRTRFQSSMIRSTTTALGVLFACAVMLLLTAAAPSAATARSLDAYKGLGTWIDIYDPGLWDDPAGTVAEAAAHHVRTLYVETANYHAPAPVFRPADLGALIEAAHARKMKVVAWYLPGFADLTKDYGRSMAAIDFRSPNGQRFDSFCLDIEASIVKNVATRTQRLLTLSARLRKAVGGKYTLSACIPSPVGMRIHNTFWPGFPYKQLLRYYDVIVPMGYHTYHGHGYSHAYRETGENIEIVRAETGNPKVPIHLIGGAADIAPAREVQGFVRAVREHGIIGAGYYDMGTTSAADWKQLQLVRTNPVQRPVLPLVGGSPAAVGRLPQGDKTHPKEVFYETKRLAAGTKVRFRAFDCQKGEVRLLVNWVDAGPIPAGPKNKWSAVRTVTLPAKALRTTGRNVIAFVARGTFPAWTTWGVRNVTFGP